VGQDRVPVEEVKAQDKDQLLAFFMGFICAILIASTVFSIVTHRMFKDDMEIELKQLEDELKKEEKREYV
jgi:uncharacterized membrane protein